MEKIIITSSQTVIVTPNLKVKDLTDPNSMNPNKLRATMDWTEEPVKIMIGVGEYPAYVAEWNTVKALEAAKILTIQRPIKADKVPQKEEKKSPKL